MKTLFEIGSEMQRLDALLDAWEGDLSKAADEMPEIDAILNGLAEDQAAKLDGYVNYLKTLEMEAVAAKAEEEQWAAKRKARERRAAYLKDNLKAHLERTGQQKVATATGRVIALQQNGGDVPLQIDDFVMLPDEAEPFMRQPPRVIDKGMVRLHLVAGNTLSFARLLPRGQRLVIR